MTEKKIDKKITFVVHSISVDSEFWEKMKKKSQKNLSVPLSMAARFFLKQKQKNDLIEM